MENKINNWYAKASYKFHEIYQEILIFASDDMTKSTDWYYIVMNLIDSNINGSIDADAFRILKNEGKGYSDINLNWHEVYKQLVEFENGMVNIEQELKNEYDKWS